MRYSVCITHRNNIKTLEKSLSSILDQIDDNFEVVIVDAESKDGSLEILRRYAANGKIKLIVKKSSRGRGRQLAFENSSGDYIIANMDMDDVFNPVLEEVLSLYHRNVECKMLLVQSNIPPNNGAVTIAPRTLIEELVGWRDLNYYEDHDLWCRAAKASKYRWTYYPLYQNICEHGERKISVIHKARYLVARNRDNMRIGRFDRSASLNVRALPVLMMAWIESQFLPRYLDIKAYVKKILAEKYFVDFGYDDGKQVF